LGRKRAFTLLRVEKRAPTAISSETLSGLIAIALAATLWAVAAAVARALFDDGVDPLELVQARALLSAAGLALVPAAWRRPEGRGDIQRVIVLGLCIALVNAAYYIAIQRLAVAVAIVLQYLGPALVVLWTAATLRRKPSREVLIAVLIAFTGVVLVSELPAGNLGRLDGFGIAAGLASAVLFASYTVLSEKAAAPYGIQGALLRGFAAASLFWIVFQSFRGWPEELFTRDHLPLVLFVGLVGTLAPFLLYLWGVERVRAERASIAATVEPVLVALIAWLWLGQALSAMQLTGGALIIGAVLSLQIRRPQAVLVPEP
jgi:DME family drug/metabolite transporter